MSTATATSDVILTRFFEMVIEPMRVVAKAGRAEPLSYTEYLSLPDDERSGDEAPVVDDQFTKRMLLWLGWDSSHYRYNAPEAGRAKSTQRPDFRVFSKGSTAFVVEDKASSVVWSLEHLPQLRKYASGTTGLALWTNLREIHLLRFGSDGGSKTLAVASIEALWAGGQPSLLSSDAEALRSIYDLLNRDRFEEFEGLLEVATADEPRVPLTSTEALDEFISGSHAVLEGVGRSAASQVRAAQISWVERSRENSEIIAALKRENEDLLTLGWSSSDAASLTEYFAVIETKLGSLVPQDVDKFESIISQRLS